MSLEDTKRAIDQKVAGTAVELLVEDLRTQSHKLPDGTSVVFVYSGPLSSQGNAVFASQGGRLWAHQVVGSIAGQSNGLIGTIDHTPAMQLIFDQFFREKIFKSLGPETGLSLIYGDLDASGQRIANGLVDEISQRFVIENAHIPTVVLAPFARVDGVFLQSEFPVMIDRSGTPIQGYERGFFAHIRDTSPEGIRDAQRVVKALSLENAQHLSYHVDQSGRLVAVDTSKFWTPEFAGLAHAPVMAGDVKIIAQADLLSTMDTVQKAELSRSVQLLDKVAPEHGLTVHGLGKHSGVLIGAGIGLGLAAGELLDGRPAQAAEVFYEIAVPYGETQIDLARGDVDGAARSATIETAANVGCVVGGVAAGGTVTYLSGGAAVPTGLTTAATVAGCAGGGALFAAGAGYAFDGYGAAKEGAQAAYRSLADLFNGKADTAPPRLTLTANEAFGRLPDRVEPGMPPEVESLVLFKGDRALFDRQFDEIAGYESLDVVQDYLEQNPVAEHNSELQMTSGNDKDNLAPGVRNFSPVGSAF